MLNMASYATDSTWLNVFDDGANQRENKNQG